MTTEESNILEFFFSHMQISSAHMNGQHHWRLRGNCWPMTHAIGSTPQEAMRSVLKEIKRSNESIDNGNTT